jgi:hypothetical protein
MMRILSLLIFVLLITAFTTADSTPPNLRGDHQVIRALQDDPDAPLTLDTRPTDGVLLEETSTARKLVTRLRRSKTSQIEWKPKPEHISEEREMAHTLSSRNAKKNLPSTSRSDGIIGTARASQPRSARPPLKRQQGSINLMNSPVPLYRRIERIPAPGIDFIPAFRVHSLDPKDWRNQQYISRYQRQTASPEIISP